MTLGPIRLRVPACAPLVLIVLELASNARAATFTVNSAADAVDALPGDGICLTAGGVCTLRAAVQEANALAGADTVILPPGTYPLTRLGPGEDLSATGDLDIRQSLTITGGGARTTFVDGNGTDRVFDIPLAGAVIVSISGVTIRNGSPLLGNGGCLRNLATATLTDVTVSGCSAGEGGGVYNDSGATLTILGSTLSGNTATTRGGGARNNNGTLSLTNCTLSGNTANQGGGVETDGAVTLTNVTVAANSASSGSGIRRPAGQGSLTLKNTIVANNVLSSNCNGGITSLGHNLDSANSCGLGGPGDLSNANPLLGPLQNNGGPTQTFAPLTGSPAIDAGDNAGCPATDQRGAARPQDGDVDGTSTCDIGAVEALVSLTGHVFEDSAGDALPAGQAVGDAANPGRPGATVQLYQDNGDALPGAGDTLLATVTTGPGGLYGFVSLAAGTYWVVVSSKTVAPSSPFGGGFAQGDVWAEQTYATAGARCSNGSGGTSALASAGPCYGGQRGGQSDNTAALATAEHVTKVVLAAAAVTAVDFGFSFNVVTDTRGGDSADDDAGANRTVQGTLRQFLENANALQGANVMRFVPAVATNASGGGGNWWRIGVTTALPAASDAGTTIDGQAYSSADGTTVRDDNPGTLGAGGTVGVDALALGTVARPELEIQDLRSTAVLPIGLDLQGSNCVVTRIAIYGFGNVTDSDTHANIRSGASAAGVHIEQNVIGTSAAVFADPGAAARSAGDCVRGVGGDNGFVRNNLVGFCAGTSVALKNTSTGWLIEGNEIRGSAVGWGHLDGVELEEGSASNTVRGNLIVGGDGTGVDGFNTGGSNTIVNNTITGNGIGVDPDAGGFQVEPAGIDVYGTGNVVDRNIISGNFGAGILVIATASKNTFTRNSIFANGTILNRSGAGPKSQIGIDLTKASDNQLQGTSPFYSLNDSGDADAGGNTLLNFPVLTSALASGANLVVRGFARPGSTIEFSIAEADPSGFGEGKTYLFTGVEGSASDTDAGTGSYGPGAVNGIVQGTDTTNRFTFTVPLPGGVGPGTLLTATATDASGNTSEFSGNVAVIRYSVVKRAFLASGAPVADGTILPRGTLVKFLLYINNPGGIVTDVSVDDALDPAFAYVAASIHTSNSVGTCVSLACTPAEEAAIFAAADAGTGGTDAVDGDAVSFAPTTVHAGNQVVANAQLDIAAGKVWATVFTVRMQ